MKNMKIAAKLLLCFLIVIAMAVLIGVVGIVGMNRLNDASSDMYKYNLTAIEALGNLRELFGVERSDMRNIFLSQDDPDRVRSLVAGFDTYKRTAEENFAVYDSTIQDTAEEADYLKAKEAYLGEYAQLKTKVFALVNEGRFDEGYATFVGGAGVIEPITNGFDVGTEKNNAWAAEADQETNRLYATLTLVLIAVMAVAFVASVTLAIYISRMISRPVKFMNQVLSNISMQGRLRLSDEEFTTIRQEAKSKDEVGQSLKSLFATVLRLEKVGTALEAVAGGDLTTELDLLSDEDTMGVSLQSMIENLNNMFGEIKTAAEQVSVGSKQIADGAQSLAQGSTEQAASVEELSASIGEIAAKTKDNARTAREAASLSGSIKENAEKGSAQMEHMMQAVREINDASSEIEKVIKVIDDIAFQTNILALNAAVEAARAGSAGKGFAVVAEEVRNLAAKSADAAKDTGGLIENSVSKANLGLNIATETSASLKEIVEGINRSAEIIANIASSSDEQAGAIEQVNTGIDQVAQVVQQNSATAEQSAAASEQMSGQSSMLDQLISQFKIKDTGRQRFASSFTEPRKSITPTASPSTENTIQSGGDYGKY